MGMEVSLQNKQAPKKLAQPSPAVKLRAEKKFGHEGFSGVSM